MITFDVDKIKNIAYKCELSLVNIAKTFTQMVY